MNYVTGLVFVMCMAAGLTAQTPGQEPPAVLREVIGRVEIKTPGNTAWIPAEEGMPVETATVISTGFKSTALLVLGNSTITVQPLTRLSLEELVETRGNEQVDLYLRTGRVRAEVLPPVGGRTEFTVRSPIATASVRGTVFDFDTVNLTVAEGRVQFAGAAGSPVPVRGGESSSVNEVISTVTVPREEQAAGLGPAPGTEAGAAPGGTAATGGTTPADTQGGLDLTLILEGAS